ncbi:MAG: thioredoxin-disulfide reductase [Candidatus Bathyarchaeia archaeon]
MTPITELYDILILGSGPAGLTAAIYTCRARLKTLVIGGSQPGGQLMFTMEVENFPGFHEAIPGSELIERMRLQAQKFGASFVDEDATSVDFLTRPFKVYVGDRVFHGRSIIIATGSSPRWLGLASEERLRGRGVSSCAICDAPLFLGKKVAVVGGGDTAIREALHLSKFAKDVIVVHRRDRLRAEMALQERALRNERIHFAWNSIVIDILGEEVVKGIRIKDLKTGDVKELDCDGVFVAIGRDPNTKLFRGQIELDERGYVMKYGETGTNIKGIFCAGDVCDARYQQAITAAASGCMAAIDAEIFLEEEKEKAGTPVGEG